MDRQITYKEQDLHSTLGFSYDLLKSMEFQIEMMEEQAINLRDNLDWKSVSASLRVDLEKLKETVARFGIIDIEYNQMRQVQDLCFNESHIDEIKARFAAIDPDVL